MVFRRGVHVCTCDAGDQRQTIAFVGKQIVKLEAKSLDDVGGVAAGVALEQNALVTDAYAQAVGAILMCRAAGRPGGTFALFHVIEVAEKLINLHYFDPI